MPCRHGREECEQCSWERHEQQKRFDAHVTRNLQIEREAIERSQGWRNLMAALAQEHMI